MIKRKNKSKDQKIKRIRASLATIVDEAAGTADAVDADVAVAVDADVDAVAAFAVSLCCILMYLSAEYPFFGAVIAAHLPCVDAMVTAVPALKTLRTLLDVLGPLRRFRSAVVTPRCSPTTLDTTTRIERHKTRAFIGLF